MVDIRVGTIPPSQTDQGRYRPPRRRPRPKKKTRGEQKRKANARYPAARDGIVVTLSHAAERRPSE